MGLSNQKKYYRKQVKKGLAKGNRYHYLFTPAEKVMVVNDGDPDLEPIEIPLPQCPNLHIIDGYDNSPTTQYFRKTKIPEKLINLQKSASTIKDCFDAIKKNPAYYKDEIEFIKEEHRRIRDGYWFFNNGKPTYITGNHYAYLNYWRAGSGSPEYRSRDRKFFLFDEFVKSDPFCCGFNYPKFRREGATSKVSCIIYFDAIKNAMSHLGIQSKDEKSAEMVFQKHIVLNWKRMPFFFRPVYDGTAEPKKNLNFFPPNMGSGRDGGSANYQDSLETWIDFGSSTEGFYDGQKLYLHYGDEVGKSEECDIYTRHLIVKPCVTEGNRYIGRIINTSTVGDMEKGAGNAFKHLCSLSNYHQRNENGETPTGLYNLFISSADGFDLVDKKTGRRFIDRFGNSDKEACEKYLLARRKALLDASDMNGLAEEIRQYPLSFRECFRAGARQCNFNINILENRIEQYRFGNTDVVKGNFEWEGGVQDSKVIWMPNPQGRFKVSFLPPDSYTNQSEYEMGVKVPLSSSRFVAGGDPFKYGKVKHESKKSLGAGAVYYKFDPALDNPSGDPKEWKSDNFVCTYLYRPPTVDEYCEDMLKMCVFYSCQMFPEVNVSAIWDHFVKRGYNGYLFYQINQRTGKYEKTPGAVTLTKIQEKIFALYQTHIERNGHREKHDDLLIQCRDIEDDMGPFDLFVAGGYALMAAERPSVEPQKEQDASSYYKRYKYRY